MHNKQYNLPGATMLREQYKMYNIGHPSFNKVNLGIDVMAYLVLM